MKRPALTALACVASVAWVCLPARSAQVGGGGQALAGPAAESDVLFYVNGEPLLRSAVDEMLAPLSRGRLPPERLAFYRQRAVRELVTNMLLGQFLKSEKFTPTPAQIDAEIARLKGTYESSRPPGAPSFEESLRARGATVEHFKKTPPPRMSFSSYVRGLMTDRDIRRTFETERRSLDGTQVRVRHILLETRSLKTAEEREAARNKAEELRKRALAGEDFAELAKKHSEGPSAPAGGELGFFPRRGKMVEPFAAAAFALKKDGISPVVETQFGYHIIQTTEIKPGREITLEEVRAEVEELWAAERGREIYADIMKTAKVERPER